MTSTIWVLVFSKSKLRRQPVNPCHHFCLLSLSAPMRSTGWTNPQMTSAVASLNPGNERTFTSRPGTKMFPPTPEVRDTLWRGVLPTEALSCGQQCYLQRPRQTVPRETGLQSPVEPEGRKPRVRMPSRDSLWSVDPDDVQVAEVDTLFIHQGGTGAALGPAGPPGRVGSRLLPGALCSRAELSAQDHWGERETAGQREVSAPRPRGTRATAWMPDPAEQVKADEACHQPPARNKEEKG